MLHVLSSARGVFFEGLNYFRKIGACEKQGRRVVILQMIFFDPSGGIYEVQRVHFICFLVSVLLYGYGTIEVCRVEVVALYLPRVRVLSCLW